MSKTTEVRLTLAAFLYSIENDLKFLLTKYIVSYQQDLSFLKNHELEGKIVQRYLKDNPTAYDTRNPLELVEYLDLFDIIDCINKNLSMLPSNLANSFAKYYESLVHLVPVRNRVMHTRPLQAGDFVTVYEFVLSLTDSSELNWSHTILVRNRIESDPSYVLTLTLPFLPPQTQVLHNLPAPDFDETGFVGRGKEVEEIRRLVQSSSVVSIIGEGGIGKTALALKVAYDLLDLSEKCKFEMIIWVTAKTMTLTTKGIEEIRNAMHDCSGITDYINEIVSGNKQITNNIAEIYEFLDVYKTLIIIDNLETVQSQDMIDFIREAQMRCNILITSRIGLGELEFRKPIHGLATHESVSLVRELARVRGSHYLQKLSNEELKDISKKLYHNPLALKWFVNSIETGLDPNQVLIRKDNLLDYCMSNIYDKLSQNAKEILNYIRGARKPLHMAEIVYLADAPLIEVNKTMNELYRTTILGRNVSGKGSLESITYYITDFAKDYMSQKFPLESSLIKFINRKLKRLSSEIGDLKKHTESNEFGLYAINIRTSSEKFGAKLLSDALASSKVHDFIKAMDYVDEARALSPNWHEVYRVSAFIKATSGNLLGAEEDYDTGLSIEPNDPRLLFYFAQFLLFELEDIEKAQILSNRLKTVRPNHLYTALLASRILNSQKNYEAALAMIVERLGNSNSVHDQRIIYTDAISLIGEIIRYELRYNRDYNKAMQYFVQLSNYFDKCVARSIADARLIKNFAESLFLVLGAIPEHEVSNRRETVVDTFNRFKPLLQSSSIFEKLEKRLQQRFITPSHYDDPTIYEGFLLPWDKEKNLNFRFIKWENGNIFAGRNEFVDLKSPHEWRELRDNQKVEFELGSNHVGLCAVSIRCI